MKVVWKEKKSDIFFWAPTKISFEKLNSSLGLHVVGLTPCSVCQPWFLLAGWAYVTLARDCSQHKQQQTQQHTYQFGQCIQFIRDYVRRWI